jgi:hypothetical protein
LTAPIQPLMTSFYLHWWLTSRTFSPTQLKQLLMQLFILLTTSMQGNRWCLSNLAYQLRPWQDGTSLHHQEHVKQHLPLAWQSQCSLL